MVGSEESGDLVTDRVAAGADARADPCAQSRGGVSACDRDGPRQRPDDPRPDSTPSAVCETDAVVTREKEGIAVGDGQPEREFNASREKTVAAAVGSGGDHGDAIPAVIESGPSGAAGKAEGRGQEALVFLDIGDLISCAPAEVQCVEGRIADPA